jgi:hypothetical protein
VVVEAVAVERPRRRRANTTRGREEEGVDEIVLIFLDRIEREKTHTDEHN